ncbi:hypothetical protein [Flavobacterium faecale]|nr:hypothetical protein [Flavobacterium faecale]
MAQGNYKKEYGGSKSGYQKGVNDTLKAVGVMIVSLASMITIAFITKKK